jgi:hypothetical protein
MYVRTLEAKLEYTHIEPLMAHHGTVLRHASPHFPIESALARDIVRASSELIEKDPLAFVTNKREIRAWIETRKESERANLADQ